MSKLVFMFLCVPFSAMASGWVSVSDGSIPSSAWRVSNGKSNADYYLCRASYKMGLHPGTIKPPFPGCRISYKGHILLVKKYQVFVSLLEGVPLKGFWVHGRQGWLPKHAWRVGYATSGRPYYLCLVNYHGLQLGKIKLGIGGCNIIYSGRELTKTSYWVFETS